MRAHHCGGRLQPGVDKHGAMRKDVDLIVVDAELFGPGPRGIHREPVLAERDLASEKMIFAGGIEKQRQQRNSAVAVAGGAAQAKQADLRIFQEFLGNHLAVRFEPGDVEDAGAGSRRPCEKWRERNAVCS